MRKKLNVIKVLRKAGVRDYARAAAQDADTIGRDCNHANSGPGADDDVYVGEPDNETPQSDPYWAADGGSKPESKTPSSDNEDSFGKQLLKEIASGIGKNAGDIYKAATSKSSGGKNIDTKNVGDILLGLGEDYVMECVRKYKAGEKMTEFERRVAMAEIKLEEKGKGIVKNKIGNWIQDHLPEIGLGFLGIIVIVTIIAKRK